MNNNSKIENLQAVLGGMLRAYVQRDTNIPFSDWLAEQLGPQLSKLTEELHEEIVAGIDSYHQARRELDQAISRGQAKEAWLAEQLASAYDGMPQDVAGERLQQLETGFMSSNMCLLGRPSSVQAEVAASDTEMTEWSEYSLKSTAYGIGEQTALLGVAAAATAVKNCGQSGIGDTIGMALRKAMKENESDIEAIAAGAVRIAAGHNLGGLLPEGILGEVIGHIAGAVVESAEALLGAARGEITMLEALDKIGRAGVVVGCSIGRNTLKGYMLEVPVVGPVLVDLFGGLFEHMESATFQNNVYNVIHDAAVATWEGMKESVERNLNDLRNAQLN